MLAINRISRQKISKNIEELHNIINQLDIIDIYRTLHPEKTEYTVFSSAHGTFTKINDILTHETKHNKLKKFEIMFSNHNEIKVEVSNGEITKYLSIWILSNMLVNTHRSKKKS